MEPAKLMRAIVSALNEPLVDYLDELQLDSPRMEQTWAPTG